MLPQSSGIVAGSVRKIRQLRFTIWRSAGSSVSKRTCYFSADAPQRTTVILSGGRLTGGS